MNIRSKLSSIREYLTPINHESNFLKTGEISPEEFVVAGDFLVSKFPTWSWGSGPSNLHKKFLPSDKQFLVTRHVPSYKRYASFLPDEATAGLEEGDGPDDPDTEWVPRFRNQGLASSESADDRSAQQDLDELIEENAEDDILDNELDDFTHIESNESSLRKYDLYIAYSTSYRVPKLYLVGFNANGIPLLPPQMYEDISGDHKDKTATIESLPMSHNTTAVSIHPCKHASVMKVFMEHARSKAGSGDISTKLGDLKLSSGYANSDASAESEPATLEGIRVDQYLVIFLKFIASVTPGIEYDFTMDAL